MKVNLQVRASNLEVIAFYEKLGYGVEADQHGETALLDVNRNP